MSSVLLSLGSCAIENIQSKLSKSEAKKENIYIEACRSCRCTLNKTPESNCLAKRGILLSAFAADTKKSYYFLYFDCDLFLQSNFEMGYMHCPVGSHMSNTNEHIFVFIA